MIQANHTKGAGCKNDSVCFTYSILINIIINIHHIIMLDPTSLRYKMWYR